MEVNKNFRKKKKNKSFCIAIYTALFIQYLKTPSIKQSPDVRKTDASRRYCPQNVVRPKAREKQSKNT